MDFGEYMRSLRTTKNMKQLQLAQAAELSTPYLSGIEKGKVPPPSEEVLIRLAVALGEDPYSFTVKAGKVPAAFQEIICNDAETFKYFRRKIKNQHSKIPGDNEGSL
ncbi:helix-turn-helix domain-containing protein [Paenibacillus chitinolyticus]|uniref:helix-turn-helix domain-containing protein n=1 Tax=Paenibacillus chitinolyticus TaxID=79263 RepID=UPI001C45017A|nr:helix-turn-helix transcriptional regulator [Paenibacillus chitinolyticus]MBV6717251.1 helix-turn-helix domain-containing protein [Paenibacillus chitinolyticus]